MSAVRRFWTEPVSGEPLAAFRIVAAVSIAASVVFGIAPDLELFFSDQGLIPGSAADAILAQTGRFSLKRGPSGAFSALDGVTGSWLMLIALLFALGFVAVGKYTRWAAAVSYVLFASFTQRSLTLTNGGDDLAVQALFYLVIAPAGAVWALDAKAGGERRVAAWSVRLIQIQLCVVYLATGLSKLDAAGPSDWLSGHAIYYALNDITLTRFAYPLLPVPLLLCKLLSWATLAFEIGFALLIWIPRIRPWLLASGLCLHAGIALTMQVGFFSSNMLMFYAVFLAPDVLTRLHEMVSGLRERITARLRFARGLPNAASSTIAPP